jgi:hypothetical protein
MVVEEVCMSKISGGFRHPPPALRHCVVCDLGKRSGGLKVDEQKRSSTFPRKGWQNCKIFF